jgi:putative MFS transporter
VKNPEPHKLHSSVFNLAVIVSGLGFLVDAFDLFLFNVYRIPSLKELGLSGEVLTRTGEKLLAIQMAGMMVGGILTGVLGDKMGRASVLFASILLYSLANIANAFVHDVPLYGVVRFLAGVGLAGELGAGITLVSERMTIEKRGYGTILVATLGALGAVLAGLVSEFIYWRHAFLGAGIVGLGLLVLRMRSLEPAMFKHSMQVNVRRGSFVLLFANRKRALTYIACILMGVPIWYSVGLVITLTPEIASLKGITAFKLSTCFILFQIGIMVGDLSSGLLSQWFRSRKKILITYMLLALLFTSFHFLVMQQANGLYLSALGMGLGCGYLSVFVTATAEHFGINLRVLTTATVTNFMRGAITLLVPLHFWLQHAFDMNLIDSLMWIGTLVWILALACAAWLPETFGKDLNYVEQ